MINEVSIKEEQDPEIQRAINFFLEALYGMYLRDKKKGLLTPVECINPLCENPIYPYTLDYHINNTITICPHCRSKILVRFNKASEDGLIVTKFVKVLNK